MAGVKGRSGGARQGAGRPRAVEPKQAAGRVARVRLRNDTDEELPRNSAGTAMAPAEDMEPTVVLPASDDPLEFLIAAMNNPLLDARSRLRAAVTAAQYTNKKTKGFGKKEQQATDAANVVRSSRFAPSAPPRLELVRKAA